MRGRSPYGVPMEIVPIDKDANPRCTLAKGTQPVKFQPIKYLTYFPRHILSLSNYFTTYDFLPIISLRIFGVHILGWHPYKTLLDTVI